MEGLPKFVACCLIGKLGPDFYTRGSFETPDDTGQLIERSGRMTSAKSFHREYEWSVTAYAEEDRLRRLVEGSDSQ